MSSGSQPVLACSPAAVGNNTAEINGIPNGINYFATPGVNTSDPWMEICCGASTVHFTDVCWLWCEIDQAIIDRTPIEEPFPPKLGLDFMDCLAANGHDFGIGIRIHYAPPTESETQSQPNESQAQPQPTESQPSAAQGQRPLLLRSVLGALATSMVVAVISTA